MKRQLTMEHAFLLSLEKRSKLTTDQEWQLNRCDSGHGGEIDLDQIVEKYGNSTWFHFKNIWIDYLGCTQIDSLIVTENGIYLIDTKNYTNHYTYQNHTWFHRDKALPKNINQQLLDNLTKCRSLSKKIPEMKDIQGTIVFINERAVPSILDPMPVNYLFRYQLFDWIDFLRQPKTNVKINIQKTAEAIKQFIVPNPYDYKSVCSMEEFAALKKGIYCKQCSSFKVDIGKYNISCSCGYCENKEQAVLRTMCEYGVLRNDLDFKVAKLFEFFDGKIPLQYLYRKLNQFFEPILKNGRVTSYKNPKRLVEFLFDEEY